MKILSSSHGPVVIILSFSFIVLHVKQSWYSDQSVISIIFSLFWKSHRSPCYPVMIRRSHCLFVVFFSTSVDPLVRICSTIFSLFWKCLCSSCHPVMIQRPECCITFSLFLKSYCFSCHPVVIHLSQCCIISFIVLKISPFSMSSSRDPLVTMLHYFFHCFENLTVFHIIQSWSTCHNVALFLSLFWKSHRFPCHPVVIHLSQCCIISFIVLKISPFSMSSSRDPLVTMLHYFFHCFENLTVFHIIQSWSTCHNVALFLSLFWKSHRFPCHPVVIHLSECCIIFSLFLKSLCSPCYPVTIQYWKCVAILSLPDKIPSAIYSTTS